MVKEIRRINATREQRKRIMKAFGISTQHLSNVLYYRRNTEKDERIRCFARQLGAKVEVLRITEE